MPQLLNTEPVAIRQSAIAAASCLKRYRDLYVDGLDDQSDETRRGTAFHAIALNHYVPRLVALGVDRDLDALGEAFEAGCVEAKLPAHLFDEVEEITYRWGESFELDRRGLLAVEERQRAFGASGQMDLVFAWRNTPKGSVLRVVDLKTYRAILNADAVRKEMQGKLYVRIAMEAWPGFDVYEFAMAFPRYGDAMTIVEYRPDELESLDRQVRTRLAVIDDAHRTGEWPAQAGEHCGFCRLKCEIADDPRVRSRRITDPIEAEIVARRLLVGESQVKADRSALKSWAMTEGPVRVGGMEFAHRKTERKKWSVSDVLAACRNAGVIPPAFECGKTILQKLIGTKKAKRAHPELVEELEAAATLRIGSSFSAKKHGDVAPDEDDDAGEAEE